jgi:hypothetical protein
LTTYVRYGMSASSAYVRSFGQFGNLLRIASRKRSWTCWFCGNERAYMPQDSTFNTISVLAAIVVIACLSRDFFETCAPARRTSSSIRNNGRDLGFDDGCSWFVWSEMLSACSDSIELCDSHCEPLRIDLHAYMSECASA